MTFTLATGVGNRAPADLRRAVPTTAAFVTHEDLAVAWSPSNPWVTSHDDGVVLVVLDGRLHTLVADGVPPAALLAARYREVGERLCEHLLGDFVVAVLDRRARQVLVGRDPVGVRPWYQAALGDQHAGASEVATLVTMPWVDAAVDERQALAYLAGTGSSTGPTLHRGISTLKPGTTWIRQSTGVRTYQHHQWRFRPSKHVTWQQAAERCRIALDEAVGSRARVAHGLTSDCSGGLDSSSIVGTAVQLGITDLVVGRLLFSGPVADERQYSDAVIRHWGIRDVAVPPWLPEEEELRALAGTLRRPPPDPNFTMFVSLHQALTAEGRLDNLTGVGGDDAFVAMSLPSRVVGALQRRRLGLLLGAARRPGSWRSTFRPALKHVVGRDRRSLPGHISATAPHRDWLLEELNRRPLRHTGDRAVDERADHMLSGYHAWAMEDAAVVADMVGRRSSHPFLDPRFIRTTYGLDPWWPLRDGHYRALQVAAYADRLPPVVVQRRSKAEFSEVAWPKSLRDDVLAQVATGPLAVRGWLDQEGFQIVVSQARRGESWTALPLSRILGLDRWLRRA